MTEDDDQSDQEAAEEPPHRPWYRLSPIVLLIAALVAAAIVASRVNLDLYAVQPGTAQSVQKFIAVPKDKGHPVSNPVLLTDVGIVRVNALSYLYFKARDLIGQGNDTSLESVQTVLGPTPPSEFDAQGALEMDRAEAAAKAAALRRLGYQVKATPAGALVFATFTGTPAFGVLHVGDVITAVDGAAVHTARALDQSLSGHPSGQTVTLSVRRDGKGSVVDVRVTLRRTTITLGTNAKGKPVTTTVKLGIQPKDQVDYSYPFPVRVDVANIGGPSAGLAMTLGIVDTLSGGDLTGATKVAATGTIDAQGHVGDVGGVPQKTVAVERAGAKIFLVPPQELKAAESKATDGLQVYAVSTLDQALSVIAAHGGHVPQPLPASLAG